MEQIINAFLKNKKFILFIVLLFFSLIFIRNRSLYHQSKFDKLATSITGEIFNSRTSISEYFNLKKINDEVLLENKNLKEALINKNNYGLNGESSVKFEAFLAKIVKNSIKSSRNYLIINKGKKDSIKEEMGIISSKGIIGIVNSVSENYSSVISILNIDLQINAKFKKNNAFGSLNWDGINSNKMNLNDISIINDVNIGDTIVTGGMSTYFPEGIPIGVVSDYNIFLDKGYYEVKIELNNKVGNETNVYVLKNKSQKEIINLE
ncbi:MAG: rod shape-determining protein MreC [Flavobacteriaceae bacterium]|nr:rod shape-determining protein MreC [Flavobacteriaceae bacterium]